MSRIVASLGRRRSQLHARRLERRWQPVLIAALVVAILGAAVLAVARRDDSGREAEAAVHDFFEARAAGDCERLADLVSEDSRARFGLDDRDDFVASCDEIASAFGPRLTAARTITTGDDRAVVAVEIADTVGGRLVEVDNDPDGGVVGGRTEAVHATAVVVREGGDWKVETDLDLLRIGASPAETLVLYYRAWLAGECDVVANLLTPNGWRAAHADDHDGYVEQCQARNHPSAQPETDPPIPRFELQEQDHRVTAVGQADYRQGELPETITLVADGLRWRLDHDTRIVGQFGVQGLMIDRPAGYERDPYPVLVGPDGGTHTTDIAEIEGTNAYQRRVNSGFRWGAISAFPMFDAPDRRVTVAVYEFDTPDGASRYAGRLVDHVARTAIGRAALELSTIATDPRPYLAVTRCGTDCSNQAYRAVGIDVHDHYMVVVAHDDDAYVPVQPALTSEAIRDYTGAVLQSQIDRLP